MTLRYVLAVSALVILPLVAYLFGRESASPVVVQAHSADAATSPTAAASKLVVMEAAPRVSFVQLYRSLKTRPRT